MTFANENTYQRMKTSNSEADFHSKYEKALEEVRHKLGRTFPSYISGSEHFSKEGTFEVRSPQNTDLLVGRFQNCSRKDTAAAVLAASDAFDKWRDTDYRRRTAIVLKAAEIAVRRKFELAAMMTFENGKNRFEAVADVDEAIDFMRYYSELMSINRGYEVEMGRLAPSEKNRSVMRPYGVWGVIAPFNFPFAIACGMTTGAVITGNTAVLKPSSSTPLMSLMLYSIYAEAGLPPGVLNYITGPGSVVGAELIENEHVAGIVFTGSRDVGISSARQFNRDGFRPFIAEMGGKNVVIVTEHADLDKAAEGTARAAFGFSGQKCSAASRVLVQKTVSSKFLSKLVSFTVKLKAGDPSDANTFVGPVISEEAVRKFENAMVEAKEMGKVLAGGHVLREGIFAKGFFVEPTIVTDLPSDSRLLREELFLPLLAVREFDTFEEAIVIANSVDYGLTAGIFSEDEREVKKFFDRIEAGVCYSNKRSGATTAAMVGAQPFVGWKKSGSTGKGTGGIYYLLQFMREQAQAVFS
ncbi:MAG: aldehyde dehydrogenase family protein [Thermoplasmata archaeon YP2-bin.285]|uniref:L-glutamate gamma-semialdehyde dehydrogenase n=1 Tax=Candidatus Sysuiplasma superficiale TaxID=2823368 RepID=A0A8J7YNY5_9ARCH|nr:aldehyde dehydrogenase family protein [Candidatus Sysuiplasma superficiale]